MLLLISLLVIEIFITILLYKRQNIIYKETYKETEEKVIQKALEIVKKYEELTINYMLKYLGDLKLIGLHSLLFNINKTDDNINFDNTDKKIYSATSDVLSNVEELKKFFGIGGKSYLDVYEEEFENNTDTTSILSSLLDNSKHPELNYISYYFPNIDELNERYNIEQSLKEREINNIKNIIPILKSLYVKSLYKSSISTLAIVFIVIAGVAFVSIIIVVLCYCCKRKAANNINYVPTQPAVVVPEQPALVIQTPSYPLVEQNNMYPAY